MYSNETAGSGSMISPVLDCYIACVAKSDSSAKKFLFLSLAKLQAISRTLAETLHQLYSTLFLTIFSLLLTLR